MKTKTKTDPLVTAINIDREIKAVSEIIAALKPLDEEKRIRVMAAAAIALGVVPVDVAAMVIGAVRRGE